MADEKKITPVAGAGFGKVGHPLMGGVGVPVLDTAGPEFQGVNGADVPVDVMAIPQGRFDAAAGITVPRGTIVLFIPPEIAAQMRPAIQKAEKVKGPAVPPRMATGRGLPS